MEVAVLAPGAESRLSATSTATVTRFRLPMAPEKVSVRREFSYCVPVFVWPAPPCAPGTISLLVSLATTCLSGSSVSVRRSTRSKLIAAFTCTRALPLPTICASRRSALLRRYSSTSR